MSNNVDMSSSHRRLEQDFSELTVNQNGEVLYEAFGEPILTGEENSYNSFGQEPDDIDRIKGSLNTLLSSHEIQDPDFVGTSRAYDENTVDQLAQEIEGFFEVAETSQVVYTGQLGDYEAAEIAAPLQKDQAVQEVIGSLKGHTDRSVSQTLGETKQALYDAIGLQGNYPSTDITVIEKLSEGPRPGNIIEIQADIHPAHNRFGGLQQTLETALKESAEEYNRQTDLPGITPEIETRL